MSNKQKAKNKSNIYKCDECKKKLVMYQDNFFQAGGSNFDGQITLCSQCFEEFKYLLHS